MSETIAEMRERIEELEAELAYSNGVISTLTEHELVFPLHWNLGLTETRILAAMAQKGGTASMEAIITAVYWMRDEPDRPEEVIKVTVARMRRKLVSHAIEIKAVTGVGYGIDRRTALRLKAVLAGEGDPLERRKPCRKKKEKPTVLPELPLFDREKRDDVAA
ncbi:MAG: helix-turn-helix domain-containing protein [Hyphomicrobiaceae bacterium]|nr:helix-turn-helix domain-containing protein [Hyphomicrobiaceae bacterium]